MQKLVKNISKYLLPFFIVPLLFVQCTSEKEEDKFDYQGKLKYFSNQYGIEHTIESDDGNAHITLPECFSESYNSFGLSDDNNFLCHDKKIHFTVDVIPKEDVIYYAEYFNDTKIKEQDDLNIIREYSMAVREFGLSESNRSINSILTTKEGEKMLLGSVKGKSSSNSKELFYQYGVIHNGDTFFLIQAILSAENTAFLHPDILQIFKSFSIQ